MQQLERYYYGLAKQRRLAERERFEDDADEVILGLLAKGYDAPPNFDADRQRRLQARHRVRQGLLDQQTRRFLEQTLERLPGEGSALADEAAAPKPRGTISEPAPWDWRFEPEPYYDPDGWKDEDGLPRRPGYCGQKVVCGVVESKDGPRLVAARIDCKRWICPKCAPKRAKLVRRRLQELVAEHGLYRFLTLTLNPSAIPEGVDPQRHLTKSWARFRARFQKHFERAMVYVYVVEPHKSGLPHLHALIDTYIPQATISEWWRQSSGASVVWIEWVGNRRRKRARLQDGEGMATRVNDNQAARYIVKYLAKDVYARGPRNPVKFRRVNASRGLRLFPQKENQGWLLLDANLHQVARYLQRHFGGGLRGWRFDVDRRGYVVALVAPVVVEPEELEIVFSRDASLGAANGPGPPGRFTPTRGISEWLHGRSLPTLERNPLQQQLSLN